MKYTTRIALLALALSALLAGRNATAEPADVAANANPKPVGGEPTKCDRGEGKEKRLETLKTDLKLSVNQEAAWTEWVSKIKGDHNDWKARRENAESWANLPAPERMEKMLAFSKEHLAKQEARLAATKTFYATLSPEQRLPLDKGFKFEHHDRFGHHRKE